MLERFLVPEKDRVYIKFENISFQYKTGKDSAVKNINLNMVVMI